MSNILDAFKQQLDINKPDEYWAKVKELKKAADALEVEFSKVWTYCPGCVRSRGVVYSKISEAYKETIDSNGSRPRTVLRCGACHSIWKFLD